MNHRSDPLPRDVQPPDPPPELRRRALASARAAMANGRVADRWHRIWTSRPLRLVWATATVGLLVGHLLLGGESPSAPAAPALPVAAAAGDAGELAEVVDLGRLTAELPGWEIAEPSDQKQGSERTSS